MKPVVHIERLRESAKIPTYETAGAAGADVSASIPDGTTFEILPGARTLVPTGLRVAIPAGYEIQVRPRSGLALKKGITVLNTPGTIDSDYRGEIGVVLLNTSHESFFVATGDRIAQLVLAEVPQADYQETSDLTETERGAGGFGSTGV